jgi:DNA-binding NtrC family response regulator
MTHLSSKKAVILVVEDEPLLRLITVEILEEAGFEVIEAANADIAVRFLEARMDIRIVITDVDMPGSMDGMKLAAAVRNRWPPIEIVIVSGQKRPLTTTLPERAVFFPKPCDFNHLTETLMRMAAQEYQVPDQSPAGPGLALFPPAASRFRRANRATTHDGPPGLSRIDRC